MLHHLFSAPVAVLAEVREEISAATRGGNLLRVPLLLGACPLLNSTLNEVFRHHGFGMAPRVALEDVLLADRYLIRKGGVVLTPYRVQHESAEHWGSDAGEFRHARFVGGKFHPASLRGFGYGARKCPGRHLAMGEVLVMVAMVVMRFDAEPVGGKWPVPGVGRSSQVAALDQPDEDYEVRLRAREGVEQRGWGVVFE